jgi:hypothetical protein
MTDDETTRQQTQRWNLTGGSAGATVVDDEDDEGHQRQSRSGHLNTLESGSTGTPADGPARTGVATRPREHPTEPSANAHRAAWSQQIDVDITSIAHELAIANSADNSDGGPAAGSGSARRNAITAAVEAHLGAARRAISSRPRGLRVIDWWRGTSIEKAFRSVHAARIFMVELLTPTQIDQLVPAALARVYAVLPANDPRRMAVENLPHITDPRQRCAAVQGALALSYDAADQAHERIRGFRNILLSGAALIAAFMTVFVIVVSLSPSTVPFCFTPQISAPIPTPPSAALTVCPSGDLPIGGTPRAPTPVDIQIVAGLGLLGGALAAAISIRKISGTSTPYGVPTALALLKVPTGALTAVTGILLLGGEFVPGLSELDSQRQILAYALVLGYAQQLATRFLDDRANSLLAALPDKKQQTSPATSVPTPPTSPPPQLPPSIAAATSNGTTTPASPTPPRTGPATTPVTTATSDDG